MDKITIQETIVSNFAQLLGSKASGPSVSIGSGGSSSTIATADDFAECLSETVGLSDVVCTIPAMELKVDAKSKDAMPNVGNSFTKPCEKPTMDASVLDASDTNPLNASNVEKRAIQSLGATNSWTKSTLVFAPQAVSQNVSSAFLSLVASRVRAWTLLLLRHSLTTGDASSRARLLSMLSSNVEVQSTSTCFKTLPLPESAKSHVKEADVILPLLFEASLTILVQGKADTVFLRAHGTISGDFGPIEKPGLIRVDVRLDTNSLLESLVEQARLVVFKAVARATAVNTESLISPPQIAQSHSANLSSFNSALKLTPDVVAHSPQLQKARSSALRLNSVLHGKSVAPSSLGTSTSTSKIRKNRSVQWDHALGIKQSTFDEPSTKRPRLVQSQNRLRSFRSFGRPQGSDGAREAKNATFGDFGRASSGPIWGRDGKMAYHPPAGGGLGQPKLSNLIIDSQASQNSNQNASFDLNAPPRRMKRTATALEAWLMNTATR